MFYSKSNLTTQFRVKKKDVISMLWWFGVILICGDLWSFTGGSDQASGTTTTTV